MSTYTKTTNFTAKDNLTSGDPAKVIKGSEFDTEFNSIETAVNSKADANNGTHTGTTTISTADIDTLQIDSVTVTATSAELNTLDGITSTTAELNKLDGFTGDYNDLNYAKDLRATGVTSAEFDILDGLTSTTAELNLLDGVTATTAELNYVDGVASNIQTQLNSKANLSGANFTGNVDVAGDLSTDGLTVDDTTGTVVIDAGQFVVRNPDKDANIFWSALGGDSEQTAILGHGSGTKLQTTATGIDVTGDVSTDTLTIDGTTVTATAAELNYVDGVTSNIQTQLNGKATSAQGALADSAVQPSDNVSFGTGSFSGEIAANGGIALGDNDKATFGASDDLEIYHDGSQSRIVDTGTGNLKIQAQNFAVNNVADTENMITAEPDGFVKLFYNGAEKLATTSTGVDVTGTVTADGLTVVGTTADYKLRVGYDATRYYDIYRSSAGYGELVFDGSQSGYNGYIFTGADGDRLKIANNGDVHFYEDTGTTAKFVWDSSAESLSVNKSNNGTPIRATGTTSGANEVTLDLVDSATGKSLKMLASGASYNYAGISGSETALYTYGTNLNLSADGGEIKLNTGSAGAAVERMRIDSSGNVGIGTASPTEKLEIQENTNSTDVKLRLRSFNSSSAGRSTYIAYNPDTRIMGFGEDGNELNIDSSGNVGIGTASPTLAFGGGLQIKNTTTANVRITKDSYTGFDLMQGSDGEAYIYNRDNNFIAVGTNNSERARMDSSGNLLVGKTGVNDTVVGQELLATGVTRLTSDGAGALYLNRKTSDGEIAVFRKDGSTVGSIGSFGSADLSIGTGDVGISFSSGGDIIVPHNISTNTYRDGGINLGYAGSRFKDLYLSGGVYLGGTGAVNKLDDYETGTWTPALDNVSGFVTGTLADVYGRYTKIGENVTIEFEFSIGGQSGNVSVDDSIVLDSGSLPFTPAENGHAVGVCGSQGAIGTGDNTAMGYIGISGTNGLALIFHSVKGTNSRASILGGTATYRTTA